MNSEERQNPEELLNTILKEENRFTKGRLKIFIGMAAGVGKTYAMLEEAQELQLEGVDIVVGTVETHGRSETALLLEGLKIIPTKVYHYKGKEFQDLDLDAILRLQPQLVLIDELAHTNIPGLRHAKRWQDVIEILDNGIDVYATLNVQHIESLNDIVGEIVEISVRETVPDLIIEKAASIQLVDLTPDELLERLKEGKVYLGDQSKIASQHFFQKDRLAALREIVLRYTAEKVDRDLRNSMPTSAHVINWKPREKFLVAISPSPYSPKLIRTARRLAYTMDAPWFAVYVNNGQSLSEKESNQLAQNLQLARDLGAEIITINDPQIADGIKTIAKQKGITQIILGRNPRKSFFHMLTRPTLLDKLSTECTNIDIHVIRQEGISVNYRMKGLTFPAAKQLVPYLLVFLCVCLLTGINWLLLPFIGYKIIGVILLIGILALSLLFKKGPIFFASILYALAWDFFFIPPANQFNIASSEDLALLALYFLTAIASGILVDRAKEQKEMLAKSEAFTRALYEIGQSIARASSPLIAFRSVKELLNKTFEGDFEILEKQLDNGLVLNASHNLDEYEKSTILWVFENGKEAGWSTDTLPSSKNLYIPLKGFHEVLGILIFKSKTNKVLSTEEKIFIYTVCSQLASYLERAFSAERTRRHEQLRQIENIHKTILARLSHEFKLPLQTAENTIEDWKKNPKDSGKVLDVEKSFHVFHEILSNISAMAQLSEGMIPINKSLNDVSELIEGCCNSIKTSQNGHKFKINIQEKLEPISFDSYLIHMLLYNLIMNALEYSPPASTIEIEAKKSAGFFVLSVSDEGKGIPEHQLDVIFEKFYRLPEVTSPGMGLGLAIAKTIAEAHHGYLKAENLTPQGAKFSLFIPLEDSINEKKYSAMR
ncbi:MAG: histidine kinase [Parachlamydia sp.]|nr:MAG: histidine kinase [Parachlamydia sp.]